MLTEFLELDYGGRGLQRHRMDLFVPSVGTDPLPVIVGIHGGGWKYSQKEDFCTPEFMRPFLERGFAFARINYRYSSQVLFPAQIHDCKGAIRFLRAHALRFGIDVDRFGAVGNSAGGHLVALLGVSGHMKELEGDVGGHLDQSSAIQAACPWFGPTDLLLIKRAPKVEHDSLEEVTFEFLGGWPDEKRELAVQASPAHLVSPRSAPFLILHGSSDSIVPVAHADRLAQALRKAGIPVALHVIDGAGHGGPEFSTQQMTAMMLGFFGEYLVLGA